MNLDPRINKLSDILTCTDIEEAEQFIGQKGYFANEIELFHKLSNRLYGALACADDCDLPFRVHGGECYWRYFIPESRLKPVEEKEKEEEEEYKPFDSTTFEKHYDVGSVIIYRRKNEKHLVHKAIVISTTRNYIENEFYIVMRGFAYTLDELFKNYEIYEFGEWKPFGVKE